MPPVDPHFFTPENTRDGTVVTRSADERGPYREWIVPQLLCASCKRVTTMGLCGCSLAIPVQVGEMPYRVYDADVKPNPNPIPGAVTGRSRWRPWKQDAA
jgi:hypothetical protein